MAKITVNIHCRGLYDTVIMDIFLVVQLMTQFTKMTNIKLKLMHALLK